VAPASGLAAPKYDVVGGKTRESMYKHARERGRCTLEPEIKISTKLQPALDPSYGSTLRQANPRSGHLMLLVLDEPWRLVGNKKLGTP